MDKIPRLPSLFFRQGIVCFAAAFLPAVLLFCLAPGAVPFYFLLGAAPLICARVFRRDRDRRSACFAFLIGFIAAALFLGCLSLQEKALAARNGKTETGAGVVLDRAEEGSRVLFFSEGRFFPSILLAANAPDPGERVRGEVTLSTGLSREARAAGAVCAAEGTLTVTGRDPILYGLEKGRDRLLASWGEGEAGAFYRAALLGDRSGLPLSLKKAFAADGAMHLLAVSGLHVSQSLGVIYFLLMALTRDRRLTRWTMLLLLPVVAVFAGRGVPVLRAVCMTGVSLAVSLSGRRPAPMTGLAFTAVIIALFRPYAVGAASFLLTFCATRGIIAVAGPLTDRLLRAETGDKVKAVRKIAAGVLGSFCVSLSCFVFTLPCQAFFFGAVQPFAALYNLFLIPLFAPVVALGILAAPAAFIPALGFLQTPAGWYAEAYLALIRFVSSGAVGTQIPLGAFAPAVAAAAVAALAAAFALRVRTDRFLLLSTFFMGASLIVSVFV